VKDSTTANNVPEKQAFIRASFSARTWGCFYYSDDSFWQQAISSITLTPLISTR